MPSYDYRCLATDTIHEVKHSSLKATTWASCARWATSRPATSARFPVERLIPAPPAWSAAARCAARTALRRRRRLRPRRLQLRRVNIRAGAQALAAFVRRHPRLVVLTGAGCSTASGIPDYRDAAGNWKPGPPVLGPQFVRELPARQRYWARSMNGWPRFRARNPMPHIARWRASNGAAT